MKVLFIASYSGTSGANQSLVTMVRLLRKKGIQPLILLPQGGPLEQILKENNIPYKKMRIFSWVTPLNKYSLLKERIKWILKKTINMLQEIRIMLLVKKENIDLVHINAITIGAGYYAAKINNIPIVWHVREFLEEDLGKKFWNRKEALNRVSQADAIVAISDSIKNKYSKLIKSDKLVRIYNGIEIEDYKNIQNKIFNNNQINLTLAGRLVQNKGHEDAIYALSNLIENNLQEAVKMRFVGAEGEKEYIMKLKKLIKSLQLEDYVDFLGYRKDMPSVWEDTDIALVCSKAEAFGRVTIEAMMAGSLVIGANTAGTAELLSNKNGLVYEQGNYLSLAENIRYALNHKKEMKVIALKASEYAKKKFSAQNNANNIFEIYNKCI